MRRTLLILSVISSVACSGNEEATNDAGTDMADVGGTIDADMAPADMGHADDFGPSDMAGNPDMQADAADMAMVTTARERLEDLWAHLADGTAYTDAEYRALYADSVTAALGVEQINEVFSDWATHAPFTALTWEGEDATFVVATATGGTGAYWRFFLSVEPDPPNRIISLNGQIALDLIPGRQTLPAANEIDVFVNNDRGMPADQAGVEILDDATGLSLVPAVTGTTDAHGWVRLTVPSGQGAFALSATGADGYRVIDYNDLFAAGGEARMQLLPRTWVEEAAVAAGKTLDPTKGTLFTLATWTPTAPPMTQPPPGFPVGCATVATTPTTVVDYASPFTTPPGRPDPTATSTSPRWATAWHFNVDPGAYGVDVSAGTVTASFTAPNVPADTWVVLRSRLAEADYPENPTEDSCYAPVVDVDCNALPAASAPAAANTVVAIRNNRATDLGLFTLDSNGAEYGPDVLPAGSRTYLWRPIGHTLIVRDLATNDCVQAMTIPPDASLATVN